jgi:hypothetical protein
MAAGVVLAAVLRDAAQSARLLRMTVEFVVGEWEPARRLPVAQMWYVFSGGMPLKATDE